jgi:hypothetical protein
MVRELEHVACPEREHAVTMIRRVFRTSPAIADEASRLARNTM